MLCVKCKKEIADGSAFCNWYGSALKTSKEDKENHGLGTQIINDIAYKYNGNVKYEIVDNQFIANVMLECVKTTV